MFLLYTFFIIIPQGNGWIVFKYKCSHFFSPPLSYTDMSTYLLQHTLIIWTDTNNNIQIRKLKNIIESNKLSISNNFQKQLNRK